MMKRRVAADNRMRAFRRLIYNQRGIGLGKGSDMGKKILVVVDMQNDFVDGALGTPEAEAIVPAAVDEVEGFDGEVLFTQDTHAADYLDTQEGRNLPVEHCIKGTPGWDIIAPLRALQQKLGAKVFEKPSFGSAELARYLARANAVEPIESIEFIGLCTDICVVSNALLVKAVLPEVPLYVKAGCCAGVTPASHDAALATLASCQVKVL